MSTIRLVKFVPFASTGGETETIKAEQALQPNTEGCSSCNNFLREGNLL
ncbi:hypothetical protein SLEP1_g19043 [Rubroshorea leprosula]|nr:hypothetical protein SLEP1_g19043 [Rubroshorea leprosula]